ncbi:uncharacterized protein LOC144635363 [Oculina patagonica]
MAVVGVLTKKSGALVEFKHDLHSAESCQGNKENLKSLAHSLRKLQYDVNSCLTEIIEQEKTSTPASQKEISEDDESDDSDDDPEDIDNIGNCNGGQPSEPQPKKLRR